MAQSIEYDYLSDKLWNIEVEEYYNDGTKIRIISISTCCPNLG
ncbi:MAG: hypothetical protein R3Y08_02065 [Rikenellaceae bacterium]